MLKLLLYQFVEKYLNKPDFNKHFYKNEGKPSDVQRVKNITTKIIIISYDILTHSNSIVKDEENSNYYGNSAV